MPDSAAARWAATKTVFNDALECPTGERDAFLALTCRDDGALHDDVKSLLAAHTEAGDFLDGTARDRLREGVVHQPGLKAGARLGAYRVLHEIARGGMGTVYLAERADEEFHRRVAIKLVTRGMDTELVLRRFRHERQILAELEHPNIARLLEGGTTPDARPYLVMEYIEGEAIDRFCASEQLSLTARLELFREVCAAVQYAHQRLIVHRDIKPGNILVTTDGVPKLLDFGIATLLTPQSTSHGAATPPVHALTPAYTSPEQLRGGAVMTLADIYSLGVVLQELLTGVPPTPTARGGEASRARVALIVDRDLDAIVRRALRDDPAERYESAQALSEDVLRYLRGFPVTARAGSWSYRARKFTRRNRYAVALGAISSLSLIVGSVAFAWQAHVADASRVVAERRFDDVRKLALSFLFEVHDSIAALPGSTRARQLIVTRSLAALDALAKDDVNGPALRKDIAAGYLKVGDVQGQPYHANLGRTAAALSSYRRAAALLTPIAMARGSDARAQQQLAVARTKIGAVQLRGRDWLAAEANEREAITLMESVLARTPGDTSASATLADALIYFGDALAASDDHWSVARIVSARDAYTRALGIRLALLHTSGVTWRLQPVSQAYNRLGYVGSSMAKVTGDTGQLVVSLANHRAAQQLRRQLLLADPASSAARRVLADGWMDMAQVEESQSHLLEALAILDSAGPMFRALGRADRSNAEARRDLAYYAENRSALLVAVKRPVAAAAAAREAIATLTRLQHDDPVSVEEYYHLAHSQEVLGDATAMLGKRADAIAAYDGARETLRRWQVVEPNAVRTSRFAAEIAQRIAVLNAASVSRRRRATGSSQ